MIIMKTSKLKLKNDDADDAVNVKQPSIRQAGFC